jgi:glycosyltransferase involved in cell wall biosynthesis
VAPELDVLVPTRNRPDSLAVTLTSLMSQDVGAFRLVVADQSDEAPSWAAPVVAAVVRVLRATGHAVELVRNLPRRGMAQQRQFLLDRATGRYVLFLDDDVVLEPFVLRLLLDGIRRLRCGLVGCGTIGLSYADDVRPEQQVVETVEGDVEPELVEPGTDAWRRATLHLAANLLHAQRRLGATVDRPVYYRLAWASACILFDAAKLRTCGGFSFWRELPPVHVGEDVVAQLRVMARFGGVGVMPSGVYHQEVATTLPERDVDAPRILGVDRPLAS